MTQPASSFPKGTFVDTSGWAAFINRSDINHDAALSGFKRSARLVTTTYVVEECSRLASIYRSPVAVQFTWHLWHGDFAQVFEPAPEVERSAWMLFRSGRRSGLSFTDCVSIAFMRRYYISEVIAFGVLARYVASGEGANGQAS